MNRLQSSIKRFVQRLAIAVLLIFVSNLLLLVIYMMQFQHSVNGQTPVLPLLKTFPKGLTFQHSQYTMDHQIKSQLDKQGMWSMLIDEKNGHVLWSYRLPEEIPTQYTLSDIASFSRFYLKDYPVAAWSHPHGLIVVGSPKNSVWKAAYMIPTSELGTITGFIITVVICDLAIILLICLYIDRRSMKAVANILSGIQSLASGRLIHLNDKGTFEEVANQLNQTSDLLKKRSTAQENWIMGISHDVRTPLTVIIGYAENIEANPSLPVDVQQKASSIKFQGIRLRDLVDDLNMITRLEDSKELKRNQQMPPLVFGREVIAQFLNSGIPESFAIELSFDKHLDHISIIANKHLLQRAINNLLHNSIKHNPSGCKISFIISDEKEHVTFCVSDDGSGMEEDEIAQLNIRSQYMTSTHLFNQKHHGFGLYIVQQIAKIHSGNTQFSRNRLGGLKAIIALPKEMI